MAAGRRPLSLKIAFVIMAAFYIFIAYCIPYCHDDWDWGLKSGIGQWLGATLNSRYVGNFFVIAMTRSEWLKTFLIAGVLFSIPLLMLMQGGRRLSLRRYLFANVLILILPRLTWQQTHGWVSGFANYVIAAALALFLILMMAKTVAGASKRFWLLLPLAAALSLFTENLAVFSLAAFSFFSVICAIKARKPIVFHLAATAASAVGCSIMFSSGMYGELFQNGTALSGIRGLSFNISGGFAETFLALSSRFFGEIFPRFFLEYPVLISILVVVLILSAAENRPRIKSPRLLFFMCAYSVGFCVYAFFQCGNKVLNGALSSLFFIALAVIISSVPRNKCLLLFLWSSVPAVLLPLSAVTELGPRLYYLPYIFTAASIMTALPCKAGRTAKILLSVTVALALLCCMVFYTYIYSQIRSVTAAREAAISNAVEYRSGTVFIKKDPWKYWWGRNPSSEQRLDSFKKFYGIPEGISVILEK